MSGGPMDVSGSAPESRVAEVVPLPGISERYWPSTDKPWRVLWGIGMFEDFATEDEAWQLFRKLRASAYEQAVLQPFNAVKGENL